MPVERRRCQNTIVVVASSDFRLGHFPYIPHRPIRLQAYSDKRQQAPSFRPLPAHTFPEQHPGYSLCVSRSANAPMRSFQNQPQSICEQMLRVLYLSHSPQCNSMAAWHLLPFLLIDCTTLICKRQRRVLPLVLFVGSTAFLMSSASKCGCQFVF